LCPLCVDNAGREFKMRDVPSCGVNQLTSTLKRDRELRSQLDKFLDVVERRNAHDSVCSLTSICLLSVLFRQFSETDLIQWLVLACDSGKWSRTFYRAMLYAERGYQIACRPSFCPSVRDHQVPWWNRLEFFENNLPWFMLLFNSKALLSQYNRSENRAVPL